MQINCEHCDYPINLSQKKYKKRTTFTKSAKMTFCPSCGKKVFYTIVDKYNPDKRELNFT